MLIMFWWHLPPPFPQNIKYGAYIFKSQWDKYHPLLSMVQHFIRLMKMVLWILPNTMSCWVLFCASSIIQTPKYFHQVYLQQQLSKPRHKLHINSNQNLVTTKTRCSFPQLLNYLASIVGRYQHSFDLILDQESNSKWPYHISHQFANGLRSLNITFYSYSIKFILNLTSLESTTRKINFG